MSETTPVDAELAESPVIAMLPDEKRARFNRYWREYLALPSRTSPEELRLQADIAAGVMLPAQSSLHPSTALAVASGLLQYHPYVGEGLAGAFKALTKLAPSEPLRPPLGTYVTYALEELSFRLQTLARELKPSTDNS